MISKTGGSGMKPRDYCCCAIPIFNAGIYATLMEQFTLGMLVGVLSVATPSIVGAATPSFAKWLLGLVGFAGALLQVLGFIGVAKDKPILFRRYVTLHGIVTAIGFAIAIAWTVISVSRHTAAQTSCEKTFFPNDTSSLGEIMCNIFPFVDIGVMGGLVVVLGIAQIYFFLILSSYSQQQDRDLQSYDSMFDAAKPLTSTNDIPMTDRADPWDSKTTDVYGKGGYSHVRNESVASASDILSEPHMAPSDSLTDRDYAFRQGSYPPPTNRPSRQNSKPSTSRQNSQPVSLMHPTNAYTQEPTPTPGYPQDQYNNYTSSDAIGRPPTSQAHPAEGSFGRKTPRLAKPNPYTENYSYRS